MIHTTSAQWKKIRNAIAGKPLAKFYHNEVVWNFLIADIISNGGDFEHYVNLLCNVEVPHDDPEEVNSDAWFEAQPLPPRKGVDGQAEGNTVLDLALGGVGRRGTCAAGVEYTPNGSRSWVCFIEGKMFSDCSTDTTHDPLRNQLTRVIENLLCFQADGQFPDQLFFTLITPRIFQGTPHARLYGYKLEAYMDDPTKLLNDIDLCKIPRRNQRDWQYPDLEQRLRRLRLKWVAYEDIFEHRFDIEQLDLTRLHFETPDDIQPLIQRLNEIAEGRSDLPTK